MTTEIAIMNVEAIALAADSAVTIIGDTEKRVFESAQKIFNVSENHSVGIMVYNNGSLMGMPWETIISRFISVIGDIPLKTINEYTEKLIEVLNTLAPYFSAPVEERYIFRVSTAVFNHISSTIQDKIDEKQKQNGGITPKSRDISVIYSKCVREYWKEISGTTLTMGIPTNFDKSIDMKYGDFIQDNARAIFMGNELRFPKSKIVIDQLKQICISAIVRNTEDIFPDQEYTGIVIAGFGKDDLFPSMITYHIKGCLLGSVIYQKIDNLSCSIDLVHSAKIIPFAQSDVIDTFKYGIHPEYEQEIKEDLIKISGKQVFKKAGKSSITDTVNLLLNRFVNFGLDFEESLQERKRKADKDLEDLISVLPKSELGRIAQALVDFTCFYRKYKGKEEATVKGPVDSAIISKKDGFTWIDRKD